MNVINNDRNIMSNRDLCKNHSTKTDRQLIRTCPSKLSKRDLEDLYYAVLDNNFELKRRINTLQDNNKVLNTKVHRMTAVQKTFIGKEKDCCSTTKAMVQEQKNVIADLGKANNRMTERIRVLNMRLCSAKQFLRRSPSQTTSRSFKGLTAPPASLKNSSVSMLNTKENESSPKVMTAVQYVPLEKEVISTRTVETETSYQEKEDSARECNENKCRTIMEELKQKIVGLQEELTNCHEEYSSRISHLESEMTSLQSEKQVALAASSHGLQQRSQQVERLAAKLRAASAYCNELEAQLLIEKSKVAELEITLRAVDLSNQMARSIGTRLIIGDEDKKSPGLDKPTQTTADLSSSYPRDWDESSPRLDVPRAAPRRRPSPASVTSCDDVGLSKLSDDSGYTDAGRSTEIDNDKVLAKVNEDLLKKVTDLQRQLDELRVANSGKINYDAALDNVDEHSTTAEKTETSDYLKSKCDSSNQELQMTGETNCDPTLHNMEHSTPLSKTGHLYDPTLMERDHLPEQLQKDDGKPCTSKAVSPDWGGLKLQRHHSEKKLQEVNEANKLWESYDAPVDKKVLDGTQPKTEDKIHFVIEKTGPEQGNMSSQNSTIKSDDHNSNQIPGPLPVDISEDKTREKGSKSSKSSYDKIKEVINMKIGQVKSSQGSKRIKNVPFEGKIETTERKFGNERLELKDDAALDIHSDDWPSDNNFKFECLDETVKKEIPIRNRESSDNLYFPSHNYKSDLDVSANVPGKMQEQRKPCRDFSSSTFVSKGMQSNIHTGHKIQPSDICQQYVRACNCPKLQRRNVTVFRTCSGILRFRTTDENDNIRLCQCYDQSKDVFDGHSNSYGAQTQSTSLKPHSSASVCHTYTVRDEGAASRAATPDNTDHEISSITDLPSEKDGTSPRSALSPGEDKATSSYAESCTETYTGRTDRTTDAGSLSEGELPMHCRDRKSSTEYEEGAVTTRTKPLPVAQKMEAALQSIGEELARCRELLKSQRPLETCKPSTKDASVTFPSSIAIRRARGNLNLGDLSAPKCVFTLHIGTLVLSDEAVLNSQGMSLLLAWKFYDQNLAMTAMRAARVVLFDFSTEYDVKVHDKFLDYLKNGEMPIIICEQNRQSEPFASCVLPFRETLLNTNRRADMSLTLVAGAGMRHDRGVTDALDTGDEVGVLDMWCMLRAESTLMPAINRCLAMPSPDRARCSKIAEKKPKECVPAMYEDDQSASYRMCDHGSLEKTKCNPQGRSNKSADCDLFKKMRSRLNSSPKSDLSKKAVTILPTNSQLGIEQPQKDTDKNVQTGEDHSHTALAVTVLWLTLNEECEAMADPRVHQLYVAYCFLGRGGADLETPLSLPKPSNYVDKCIFNFKKSFHINEHELLLLGHMARCRSAENGRDPRDCIIFTVISEPADDPLGLQNCEDIGRVILIYL